jgi:hypothetical protein
MDTRDFDRWARLFAASCSRRRTFQVLGAGALAFGVGRRARFEALAAELGCCKCSGTQRCELDVASYGECKTVCGANRQAIFAPDHTCTRGSSNISVCKRKRKATGAALLAGAPGAYDLAFVDRAAADTIAGLSPVTTEALFTAAAAIAAGFVQETAAAVLFEEGVQVYHSLWRDAAETLGVFSHVSQHLTAEAAARWYDYAHPQLGPAGAETFDFELSGIDAGTLIRFAFPSQTEPGVTITRLMAMTLTGEFVNWFGIDDRVTVPAPELARAFAQAVVDALIDRPEQTESLAPYVALLPGAAACLPAFPAAAAKRAGAIAARGPTGFLGQSAECEAPTGNIRYPVWDGAYVPRHGTPEGVIELNQDFFAGADRVLDQSYAVGNQIRTVTVANWWHPDVIENDGQIFFQRQAEVDAARGAVRQDLDMPHPAASGRWYCSAVAFPAGEQWMYGVDAVAFAPPYSLTLGVLQPGPPIGDPSTWMAAVDPAITEELWPIIPTTEEAMGLDDWHVSLTGVGDQSLAIYGSALVSPPQADEVVSAPGLHDLGATAAALARSPDLAGFTSAGGVTYVTAEAAATVQFLPVDDIDRIIREGFERLEQARHDTFVAEDESEQLDIIQLEFPDLSSAGAVRDALVEALSRERDLPPDELALPVPGATGLSWRSRVEEGEEVYDLCDTVVHYQEFVVTGTHRTIGRGEDPPDEIDHRIRDAYGTLAQFLDDDAWASEVGVAAQEVTPWIPWMTGVGTFQDKLIVVDGVSDGDDPDHTAAANPGVLTARVGSFTLTDPGNTDSGNVEVQWGVRLFPDPAASTDFLEQLPDLRPETDWYKMPPFDDLSGTPTSCMASPRSVPMASRWSAPTSRSRPRTTSSSTSPPSSRTPAIRRR